MQVLFDPSFDSNPYPGPLAGADAAFGEVWAGSAYLLDLLETALGLRGPVAPPGVRAAALVPALRQTAGFWSASAAADPLGTARRLVEWRDHLWMAGWRGEGAAPRLAALGAVTAGVLPGPPDRLRAVAAALARRGADAEAVHVLEPASDLPALWRTVLDGLARHGTRVTHRALDPVPASGDLAGARARDFRPVGDGSLTLLRPPGPLQAAEEVAAWLAAEDGLAATVVVGADPVLDQALRRHGVPTTGDGARPADNGLLQILPLALALAWRPPDPRRALELVTLPTGPVPRVIARRLAAALHEWPAVDSDAWRAALEGGLAAITPTADRERVRRRLVILFDATVPRGARYPVAEVRRRLDLLVAWVRGRLADGPDEPAPWEAVVRQCAALGELVDCSGLDALVAAELERFVDEASARERPPGVYPAQAGLAAVRVPGAVAGPARRVVWWSFALEAVPPIPSVPLSTAERTALARSGVALPDGGRAAVAAALRWSRPLAQTTEQLLLVCPTAGEEGTERHPHPLWDEIAARLASGATLAPLVTLQPVPIPAQRPRALRAAPAPRRQWRVAAGTIALRPYESPSSIGTLLGCAFRYAVEYAAGVRGGATAALPEAEQLLGKVTHELLARLLAGGMTSPDAAEAAAIEIFDREAPRLAAPLFLPGADAARAQARHASGLAARELVRHLQEAGLAVQAVESTREGLALGAGLRGRFDVLVGPRPALIDLKWSGGRFRRQQLAAGTAYQLAAYSYLTGDPARGIFPPVAFFILLEQRLLATDAGAFPSAEIVTGPDAAATWRALEQGFTRRREAVRAGILDAPGNPDASGTVGPEADVVEDGALVLAPPCRFCDLPPLCGRAFGES